MREHENGRPTEAAIPSNYSTRSTEPDTLDYTSFVDFPGLWTHLATIPTFAELCRRRGEVQLYGGRLIPVVIV